LLLSLGLASCGRPASGPQEGVETGILMLTTATVPADVRCIVLTVAGPGAPVTRSFDVTPGQAASMTATGLPTGAVTISEGAYNSTCAQVTAQSPLTWVSEAPVVVQLVAGQTTAVSIVLRRAGGVVIGTTFDDGVVYQIDSG